MRAAGWLGAWGFLLVACSLATVARVGVAADRVAAVGDEGFFNGKDFEGWEGLMEYWSVRDGAIVGKAPPDGLRFNTFLCSKKRYKDFELSLQVRIKDGKGNSGVQFRS